MSAHLPEDEAPVIGSPSQFYRRAWLFYLILASLGVFWIGAHFNRIPRELFWNPQTFGLDLAWGLGAGLALVGLWRLGRRFATPFVALEAQIKTLIGPLDPAEALALALLSGFSEELLFRGAMQSSWGWPWAVVVFALLHTGPGRAFRVWTAFALLAGVVFSLLTLDRGNIFSAIVAHVVINALQLRRLAAGKDDDPPTDSSQG